MTEEVVRYLREPPRLHPAIVGCLWRRGRVTGDDVAASVLRLIAEGDLLARESARQVTTIGGSQEIPAVELRVVPELWEALDPLDKELVRFLHDLLGGPSALTLADLQAAVVRRPAAYKRGLAHWQTLVRQRTADAGLLRGRLRTRAGRQAHARHKAFHRFLRDFGTLEDEPPIAVELWGEYLAYAVVLGLGDRVAGELDLAAPGIAAHPDLAVWEAWFGLGASA
jgi:hypothetical protein